MRGRRRLPSATTRMVRDAGDHRHDALLAAAHLTVAVRDAAARRPGRQVATVGQIEVTPNSPNVIPGRVVQSVELRDLSPATLVAMMDDIRARAKEIERT